MCEKCGCSDVVNQGQAQGDLLLSAVPSALAHNDQLAERNRGICRAKRVVLVNLLSFSRSQAHALVERTVAEYGQRHRLAVIAVADLEKMGAIHDHQHHFGQPRDIPTDEPAAVDAHAIGHAFSRLDLDQLDLVLIENGGSAACQAVYDLGETARVVVFSVCEGELKPLKFPLLFANARGVVINEINQAAALGFDLSKVRSSIDQVAPKASVMELSPETGVGMETWYRFLDELVKSNGQ